MIIIYFLLFVIAVSVEAILHFSDLSAEMVLKFFRIYLLDGIGVFLAISPMIALVARMKKGYWLALVFTELYSFAGLFASMSSTLNIYYPITAVFNCSGYYTASLQQIAGSMIVLLLCGGPDSGIPLSQKRAIILPVVNDIFDFDTIILFLYLKYQP